MNLPISIGETNEPTMIRNYLKIAWRQLRKQKMYAAIKIGGFALSIAACLLIGLYIRNEMSYDKQYPDANRIFRLVGVYNDNGKRNYDIQWPAPLPTAVKADIPQVELIARLMSNSLMGAENAELRPAGRQENTYENGITYADQQFLDIFQLPMVYGKRSQALAEPLTMVISKRIADKYFPGQNPVGKVMYLNDDKSQPYRIGGVMKGFPANSHLHYDFLLTLTGKEFWQGEQTNWGAFNYPVYIKLRRDADAKLTEKKLSKDLVDNYFLPRWIKEGMKDASTQAAKISFTLQPIADINLYSYDMGDGLSHGDIRFIWLFGAIAAFILIIACINFINLATAKSTNRAKEVGLRKVVGSYRSGLIRQFLTESMLYSVLSFAIGLLMAWALLPYFNILASKSLSIPWGAWWLLPVILVAAFVVGIAAGLYPAFYLSAFKPALVLKGAVSAGSKNPLLRNSLVVFQFTASIILIISTIVIFSQMRYILNRKAGFDKDQVMLIEGTNTLGNSIKDFKTELSKLAAVKCASISDYLPVGDTKRNGNTFYNEGKTHTEAGVYGQFWQIDDTYLKTLDIKLVEGRNFSYNRPDDTAGKSVIINQTLAKKLNLKNPIGKLVTNTHGDFRVIGVVKDFNFESMHEQVAPLMLHFGISPSMVTVKVNTANMKKVLPQITATWKSFAPNQPIRYTFLDQRFAAMYADVQRMGRIFTTFAILAIIIACLGLFALSAFMAEQRSREIGIRKVLGASVQGITTLLSMDFIKLVALSILIASPVAWWAMDKWLQGYAYRIEIQWWMFVAAGLSAVVIALFTVSFQSVKAAMANPIKSLKAE